LVEGKRLNVTLYVYCLPCSLISIVGIFHGDELSFTTLERITVQALGSLNCETDDSYQLSATGLQFLAIWMQNKQDTTRSRLFGCFHCL